MWRLDAQASERLSRTTGTHIGQLSPATCPLMQTALSSWAWAGASASRGAGGGGVHAEKISLLTASGAEAEEWEVPWLGEARLSRSAGELCAGPSSSPRCVRRPSIEPGELQGWMPQVRERVNEPHQLSGVSGSATTELARGESCQLSEPGASGGAAGRPLGKSGGAGPHGGGGGGFLLLRRVGDLSTGLSAFPKLLRRLATWPEETEARASVRPGLTRGGVEAPAAKGNGRDVEHTAGQGDATDGVVGLAKGRLSRFGGEGGGESGGLAAASALGALGTSTRTSVGDASLVAAAKKPTEPSARRSKQHAGTTFRTHRLPEVGRPAALTRRLRFSVRGSSARRHSATETVLTSVTMPTSSSCAHSARSGSLSVW